MLWWQRPGGHTPLGVVSVGAATVGRQVLEQQPEAQIWKDRRVLLLSFVASLSLNHLCFTKIQRCICKAPFPAVNALLAAHVSCTCPRVLPSSAWPGSLSFILRRAPVPSPVFRTLPRSLSPQSFLKHWISLIKNYSSVQSFTMIYFNDLAHNYYQSLIV